VGYRHTSGHSVTGSGTDAYRHEMADCFSTWNEVTGLTMAA
jgi:hypothetical protein